MREIVFIVIIKISRGDRHPLNNLFDDEDKSKNNKKRFGTHCLLQLKASVFFFLKCYCIFFISKLKPPGKHWPVSVRFAALF